MPDEIYFYNEKGQNDIFNLNSYGIAFIGNFNERAPNQTAIDAFHNLVDVRNLPLDRRKTKLLTTNN